jgi:tRNA(Ile)-lysidine synthase
MLFASIAQHVIFIQMDLLQKFRDHWQQQFCHLTTNNCQLLLAVSGGVDSVVLVDLVARSGFSFEIAHCNFQLRGGESERDESFVRSLGDKYGKEVLVKRFDTKEYAAENKYSIQEAARELRYAWFKQIVDRWQLTDDRKELKSDNGQLPSAIYTVTAHHADDNLETMLMYFFRGTGINGLAGIQPMQRERALIRPLLAFRKTELLEYANVNSLDFVEDSSNASDKYTRNFFRNQLIPQIKEVFPQVEENLLHNIERFKEIAELYHQSVQQQLKKLAEPKGNEFHVPVLKWKKIHPIHTLTWELIKPYGFTAAQTDEVIKLLDADNGSYIASASHRIIHNRSWMIISPNNSAAAQHILIEEGEKEILFENGSLKLLAVSRELLAVSANATEAFLDITNIRFPLLLRRYKQGDYFYPLGMLKKKKVSRFLIDQKLSKTEKEKIWVLESNKKIIWVIGYRIDDRFKLTERTGETLHIAYLK